MSVLGGRLLTASIYSALGWAGLILLALNSCESCAARAVVGLIAQDSVSSRQVISPVPMPPSVVDIPIEQLVHEFPELKKLKPAAGQELLGSILQKVGKDVATLFNDFPNVTSREEVTEQRLAITGAMHDEIYQEFRYLALVGPDRRSVGFREYRTDSKGRGVRRQGLESGYLITQGFVSIPLYFHPLLQPDSKFRYLGREVVKKRLTDVVAFAQTPQARDKERFEIGGKSVFVLLQGLAWIDPANNQIVQMRTDLRAPAPEIRLDSQTTHVSFAEVHFRGGSLRLWLPREVEVDTRCYGVTFRNTHSYSEYKLFTVQTQMTQESKPSRK